MYVRPGLIAFCSANRAKKLFFSSAHLCTDEKNSVLWRKTAKRAISLVRISNETNSILQRKDVQNRAKNTLYFFYAASMSRASWSKLGGGRLRPSRPLSCGCPRK